MYHLAYSTPLRYSPLWIISCNSNEEFTIAMSSTHLKLLVIFSPFLKPPANLCKTFHITCSQVG